MTILWLVALPLAGALALLLLRNFPLMATPLASSALLVVAILLITQGQIAPLIVWGRAVGLSAQESLGLAFCAVILAIMIVYSYHVSRSVASCAPALVAMSLFVTATMVRNLAISGLLLELGIILAVMLVPSREPGAAMAGMRALVLLMLSGPLLLIAAWALESRAVTPDNVKLAQVGGVALASGFAVALSSVPFQVWLPPVFRHGSPLAAVTLSVVLSVVVLLRLSAMLQASAWPGGREFLSALLLGDGVITAVAGSLLAAPQRSISRALAYSSLADLGLVLVGLGIGTEASISAATLHVVYRGLGIVAVVMALGILRRCLDGDRVEQLRGGFRRAPLAILGMTLGGLSLAGMPLTAGFASRYVLYRSLAVDHVGWSVAIMACSVGPTWAFARCTAAALVSAPVPGGRREPLLAGALALLISLMLLLLGVYPNLLTLLPAQWLNTLFAIAPAL